MFRPLAVYLFMSVALLGAQTARADMPLAAAGLNGSVSSPAPADHVALRSELTAVVARYPALGGYLHPFDYRTLDDRIAARELVNRTALSKLALSFTEKYRESYERLLSSGAIRIDVSQPGYAPVYAVWLRCLERFGIPEGRVHLYLFGDMDTEAFAWGLPMPAGNAIVGISTRVARLFLVGDEGLKMSTEELEFLLSRELAHLQADHSLYQMLTLFAESVENYFADYSKSVFRLLTQRLGKTISTLVIQPAMPLIDMLQHYIVSIPFRRYMVWNINASLSANRAALLSLLADHPLEESLKAATRVLLLGMLNDYHLVDKVEVDAFLKQIQAHTDISDLVRNPDRLSVDAAVVSGPEREVAAEPPAHRTSLLERLLNLLRRFLRMSPPVIPVRSAGYAKMIADLARFPKLQEFADLDRQIHSHDLYERGMLILRRIHDLDDISHIHHSILEVTNAADQELNQWKLRLITALANDLVEDLAAHGGHLEGSRLDRILKVLTGQSYTCQMASLRVLEELAARQPPLEASILKAVEAALIEGRLDHLLRTASFHEDLSAALTKLETPRGIFHDYLGYFEDRKHELIEREIHSLIAPENLEGVIGWVERHHDAARPRPLMDAYGLLLDGLSDGLRANRRHDLASRVDVIRASFPR